MFYFQLEDLFLVVVDAFVGHGEFMGIFSVTLESGESLSHSSFSFDLMEVSGRRTTSLS